MVSRQECPKVTNVIVALVKVVRSNRQLSSKVGSVLAKLLRTRLDNDEMSTYCKGMQEEKNDLTSKVEGIVAERDELAKVVADLEARLKESESKLEESELRLAKEREVSKDLEDELTMYKKEAMERHEKGFNKAIR